MKKVCQLLLLSTLSLFSVFVSAQGVNVIPEAAQTANFSVVVAPVVLVNGNEMRLSPAARIYGGNRLSVTPASVQGEVRARYTVDNLGQIDRVWIIGEAVHSRAEFTPR